MKKNILFFFILALMITSCQKEVSEEIPTNNPGSNSDTYQPLTAGSSWKYKQTGIFAAEYTIIVTSNKKTMDGIDYVELTGNGGAATNGSSWYGIKGNNYYLRSAGTSPNTGAPYDLTQLYCNDKEAAGYTWDFTGGHGNGFTAKLPGKIIEKGITITVQGKTYTDVIHTQIHLTYDMPQPIGNIGAIFYDYYMAKGVGIVKIVSEGDPDFGLSFSSVAELVEYNIK